MTIRNIFLLFFSLLTLNPLYSQQQGTKNILGVSTGVSLPYADFAKDKMVYNAGFASAGANINMSLTRTGKFFGLYSDLVYANIFFNKKAYQSEYKKILGQTHEISVQAGNYQMMHSTVGFIVKSPELFQSEIMISGRLGYSLCIHPEIKVNDHVWGKINSVERDLDGQILSSCGIQINHYFSEKYGATLSYDIYLMNPRFSDKTSIDKAFYLPMRYQNISAGLLIYL